MKGTRQPFEIKDFSGGLVTKSPYKNIDPRHSVDCENVYSEGAVLRKRLGITLVNPTAASGQGNGVYNWFRDSSSQWLLGVWGTALFKMDVVSSAWDGSWDAVVAHSASGSAFTGGFVHFANYNGVLLMTTENRDTPQRMTSAESSYFNLITGGAGTAPAAKYCTVWKNHAWFLNLTGSEDRVVHSGVNSYNEFTSDTYGTNDILTDGDIGITGHYQFYGNLYTTKKWSIQKWTYTGSVSPLVSISYLNTRIGTQSPRTIQNVNTPEGERVIFLGTNRKLHIFDGYDALDISDKIDVSNGLANVYMQNINAKTLNNCFAVVHADLNWYECFVCVGTLTTPTYSIVYDYVLKSFWTMSNRNFTYGAISDDGGGIRKVYAQHVSNGKMYVLNSSTSDDGTSINSWWTSSKLGQSITLQRIDEIEVETESVVCTPTFQWRADWETAWVSQTMAASTNSHNWAPNRIDNLIQFKIVDDSTTASFKIWTIIGSQRGIGGGQ